MLKECAERLFARLAPEKRDACRKRYGAWYEAKQQYLHALTAYEACGDYDAALQVIERDAGILLTSLGSAELLERLGRWVRRISAASGISVTACAISTVNSSASPIIARNSCILGGRFSRHRRREYGINVRVLTQQDAPFSQGVEVQVDGGEPPLAGAQQAIHLCFGQIHAAAVGVVGKLGMVEPQLFLADAVQAVPQPEDLLFGQKVVPACHDQVNILRQAICQSAQKLCRFFVL